MNREKLIEEFWKNDAILENLNPKCKDYDRILKENREICDLITGDR